WFGGHRFRLPAELGPRQAFSVRGRTAKPQDTERAACHQCPTLARGSGKAVSRWPEIRIALHFEEQRGSAPFQCAEASFSPVARKTRDRKSGTACLPAWTCQLPCGTRDRLGSHQSLDRARQRSDDSTLPAFASGVSGVRPREGGPSRNIGYKPTVGC